MPTNLDLDPIDAMLAFHRRMERQLAQLVGLAAQGGGLRAEPASVAAALGVLRCFDVEFRRRHDEEERGLLPRLERSVVMDVDREAFRALRRRLAEQHREMEGAWRDVRRPLAVIAEGFARRVDSLDASYFRHLCTAHIQEEEMALQRVLALRWDRERRHETVMELKRA